MKKLSKKLLSVLTAAAMIFTIFASPVGEIFGFVGETVKASAASAWTSNSKYGYYSSNNEALEEFKNSISSTISPYFMQRFEKILSEYPLSGYFNSYKTKACSWHCGSCGTAQSTCISKIYDDEIGSDVNLHAKQCYGYARYCFYRFHKINLGNQSGQVDVLQVASGFSNTSLKSFLDKNAIVGAHIRAHGHSMVYLSHDTEYMYLIDANSGVTSGTGGGYKCPNDSSHWATCCKINIRKITFSQFSGLYSGYGFSFTVPKEVKIDLTSAPNNLGDKFTAPIITPSGKALTAGSDGNVTAQAWANSDSQKWTFTKNSSDNYYEIKNIEYNKNLDVSNGGNDNNVNIQIWEDNDTGSQRFGIYGSQGNYVIKPSYSTKFVIDSNGPDSNVHLYTYYSPTIDAQKFKIEADPNPTFSNVKVTSVTNNNAKISALAHKKSSTTTLKFQITVWPKDNGILGAVFGNSQSFTFNTSNPNVGKTSNEITFDLKDEPTISAGSRMTLNPDTEYYYCITSYYNEGGVTVSYFSDYYTFKTTNTCSHTFGSWVTKTPATCTADGLKQRTCTKNCGKVESEVITKLGHSYTSSVTKAATCTATGVRTYKCSRCTSSYTESIAKTGHTYTTGYEAAHPHKNYKKCTTCGTYEYTGTTQYLYNCASCTNLTVPTITSITSPANINKEVTIKWTASTSDKLDHYWVRILDPNGDVAVSKNVDKTVTSYTFTPTMHGEYTINIAATPTGSPDGTGSLWANKTVKVHDYVTYTIKSTYTSKGFDHHLCSQCSAEYKDNYTSGTKAIPSTPFTVTATSKSVKLSIPTTPFIEGYVITRKCNGVVDKETTVTDPAYYSFDITGFNTGRGANELIVYTRSGRYAETNTYGIEIVVDANGYVIGERAYGSEVKSIVPEGGFVASMHNASSQFADIAIGDRVEYDMADKILTVYYTAKAIENVTYTDTTTEPGKTYTYTVTPCVKEFKGATTEKAVTIAPVAALAKPVLSATAGDKQATLNWTAVDGASYYQIIRYNNGTYSVVANINGTSATVKGLTNGYEYTYLIKAVAADGRTSLSSAVNVTPVAALAKPTLSATAGNAQATLSWTAVSGASYYQIIRYNNGTYSVVANVSTTSATVKGLTNGYEYTYLIKAVAEDGRTSFSNAVTVTPVAALGKSTLSATAGNGQATLNWTAVDGASYYQIIRYNKGAYSLIANISGTTATVKGLTNNFEYTYLIKAVAEDGRTSFSNAVTVTPVAALGKSTLSATAGNGQATLNWTAVDGASYYQIIRYNKGAYSLIANISGTTATVKGLTNNFEYTYLIKAVAEDGRTSFSNAVTVTPVATLAKPILSATAGDKQATLSWTAVDGASYYQIIRYNKGAYSLIANISGTSATVKGLTNNFEYTYLIKAVAADGRTSLSTAVKVTPVAAATKPTLSATAGDKQATLSWTAVSGASYYQIIRYNNGTYTLVANISGTSATVKGLANNFEYTYLIKAVAADGTSSFSNAVTVTPHA